jgi:hypothetical protein
VYRYHRRKSISNLALSGHTFLGGETMAFTDGEANDQILQLLVGNINIFAAELFPPWQDISKQHGLVRTLTRNSIVPALRINDIDDAEIFQTIMGHIFTNLWLHGVRQRNTIILPSNTLVSYRRDIVVGTLSPFSPSAVLGRSFQMNISRMNRLHYDLSLTV